MRKIDLDLNICLNIFYYCWCNLMIIDYMYFMITCVISWVLFYMCQDFLAIYKHQWLQKVIVFIVVGGTMFGALLGIWLNKILGRKQSMIFSTPWVFYYYRCSILGYVAFGRILIEIGLRIMIMTCPICIAEVWLPHDRGVLIIVCWYPKKSQK